MRRMRNHESLSFQIATELDRTWSISHPAREALAGYLDGVRYLSAGGIAKYLRVVRRLRGSA